MHTNKLIHAIVTCINTVHNLSNGKNKNDIHDLHQLLEATKWVVKCNRNKATEEATEPSSAKSDKSSLDINLFQQVTCSIQRI